MNLEAMAASIGHEVRQPLGSIAANGAAALRFLDRLPPNLDEVRLCLSSIVRDSHRAGSVTYVRCLERLIRSSSQST
jgi:signal transduction histidine kinase